MDSVYFVLGSVQVVSGSVRVFEVVLDMISDGRAPALRVPPQVLPRELARERRAPAALKRTLRTALRTNGNGFQLALLRSRTVQ